MLYSLQEIFTHIYKTQSWGNDETISGSGSRIQETQGLIHVLPEFMKVLGVQSFLDLGCGDFNWLQYMDLAGVQYIGSEIVPELVEQNQANYGSPNLEFRHLDMTHDPLPPVDLILIRDCLTHFSFVQIMRTLNNLKQSDFKYILITNYSELLFNSNIDNGFWRPLNLTRAPFHLPKPVKLIPEFAEGKSLGLWQKQEFENLDFKS